jgi:hypothetical protein
MGDIYRAAHFTIVATAGKNDSAGIPGVGSLARDPHSVAVSKQVTLVSTLPHPTWSISNTTWATRGWTYQEAVLSRRRLVFTPQQVYFECCAMQCVEVFDIPLRHLVNSEAQRHGWIVKESLDQYVKRVASSDSQRKDQIMEETFDPFGSMASAPFYRTGQFSGDNKVSRFGFRNMRNKFRPGHTENVLSAVERLWHQIEEYSARQLTYDYDGLNAFEGILKDACQVNKPVLFHITGLPVLLSSIHFMILRALLWSTGGFVRVNFYGNYKGAFTFSNSSNRRPSLPSWSWAGWNCKIQQPESKKIVGLDWSFSSHHWPLQAPALPSTWLAIVSLKNSHGDSLHCGENQTRCWKRLPLFEKSVYLNLEAYSYVFTSSAGHPRLCFKILRLDFKNAPTINHGDTTMGWSWEKIVSTQWALRLEPHQPLLTHLARGQSLLIPLMSNHKCIFVMLVDIMGGDLVERRGIIQFDRLDDQEPIHDPARSDSNSKEEQYVENVDELRLSSPRMVMVV